MSDSIDAGPNPERFELVERNGGKTTLRQHVASEQSKPLAESGDESKPSVGHSSRRSQQVDAGRAATSARERQNDRTNVAKDALSRRII